MNREPIKHLSFKLGDLIEKPCIFGSGNRLNWKPIPLTRPPQSWQYLY